ncbi:MAG TPA: hypothetical protein PKC67_04330 [Kiritimatiellia bacterium]|nr:hypothetical protein [Kiritimatiellia bacterium]HMP33556.1 hypothetical protein [Kiritimatiellia bacterium]
MRHHLYALVTASLLLAGCGTPSGETGSIDYDAYNPSDDPSGQPSSLFEMSFGGGESEITKNLPAAAARKVGEAVRPHKPATSPDVSAP